MRTGIPSLLVKGLANAVTATRTAVAFAVGTGFEAPIAASIAAARWHPFTVAVAANRIARATAVEKPRGSGCVATIDGLARTAFRLGHATHGRDCFFTASAPQQHRKDASTDQTCHWSLRMNTQSPYVHRTKIFQHEPFKIRANAHILVFGRPTTHLAWLAQYVVTVPAAIRLRLATDKAGGPPARRSLSQLQVFVIT